MATATQFLQFWVLAFVTLSIALVLLSVFYRLIDFDLELHSLRKELVIAAIASAFQGVGFWFSASLFHGDPFRRLMIPSVIVGVIYWLSHFEDWSGYEFGGIAFFQMIILTTGLCLFHGDFKLAVVILSVSGVCLAIIASSEKSL